MSEASSASALAVGDRVVYPNQGVCRVTAIDSKSVAGQTLTFVTMKREEDGAVVMVPEAKVRAIGVRKVSTEEDVEQIFAFLKADTEKADLDWKQRARTNVERMSQGGLMGLAEVVKGLQVLSELRPLPTKERELYDNARHLLVAEISASLAVEPQDAEDAIDILLFPPGKERPKRTAEEFRTGAGDEDLDLDAELLGDGGELDLPSEEEPEAPAEEEAESEGEEEEPAPKAKRGRKPGTKVAKAAPAPELNEDDEVTQVMASPLTEEPPKRKRGRPPKPKPAEETPAVPKKRGRPPKPKPAEEAKAPPKKRGRPPKNKSAK
jgi:RNA polymerase-interacting CarD/CdnL/TRCF family regulator